MKTLKTEHNPFFVETHYNNTDALLAREKEIACLQASGVKVPTVLASRNLRLHAC
jgi:hypothetical protein